MIKFNFIKKISAYKQSIKVNRQNNLKKQSIERNKIKKNYYPDSNFINAIDIPFIIINKKNMIVYVNKAAQDMFDIGPNNNILHVFRRPEFIENLKKLKKKNVLRHNFTLEFFSVPQVVFFDINANKMSNNNILLTFNDITRMHKLEKLRSDFIGNVSHELKTPLSVLMNVIELFTHQKKVTATEKKKLLKILEKESFKMKAIIEDLLNLTKIETELHTKIIEKVNLNKIIKNCIISLKTNAKKNGMTIIFKTNSNANITGDKDQLKQMFENIIDNSIKYAYKKSKIRIELKKIKNKIFLSFTDSGKGIHKNLIPRLSERFFRASDVKSKNIDGSGLGLAIVKYIAIRHKAKFEMSSKINIGTKTQIIFNIL